MYIRPEIKLKSKPSKIKIFNITIHRNFRNSFLQFKSYAKKYNG